MTYHDRVFGRDKTTTQGATRVEASTTAETPVSPVKERPGAKNRPTPKRKDQEAARRRPLVETDRKAAKAANKQRAREARLAQRAAAERGDDSALPARDRGPEKRYIRDRVDSRLNIGEIALPLMLVAVIVMFVPNPSIQSLGLIIVWAVLLIALFDAIFMWRSTKKRLIQKFGAAPRGGAGYAIMRAMQIRRGRFPRPAVKRGEKID